MGSGVRGRLRVWTRSYCLGGRGPKKKNDSVSPPAVAFTHTGPTQETSQAVFLGLWGCAVAPHTGTSALVLPMTCLINRATAVHIKPSPKDVYGCLHWDELQKPEFGGLRVETVHRQTLKLRIPQLATLQRSSLQTQSRGTDQTQPRRPVSMWPARQPQTPN